MDCKKKALIISNCQARALANALSIMSKDTTFHPFGLHEIRGSDRDEKIELMLTAARDEYDFVLVVPLSDKFGRIAHDQIKQSLTNKPIIFISNIYFSGLHPDLTYVGAMGARITSPLGQYHSRLALWSYLHEKSAEDAVSYYKSEIYSLLGYYDEWNLSLAEAKKRDQLVDVKVADLISDFARTATSFYSMNHPSPAVIAPFAQRITQYLDEKRLARSSGIGADPFLVGAPFFPGPIFPIFPEIALQHGLPKSTGSYAFKPPGHAVNPLSLHDFVVESHRNYDRYGRGRLLPVLKMQAWLDKFSAALCDLKNGNGC